MPTLLHIDSSINGKHSHSRRLTKEFADSWRANHTDGAYLYRDLASQPVPYLDATAYAAGNLPPEQHSPDQAEAWKTTQPVIDELASADTVLIGAPMYNYTIPSTLNSWLDRITIAGFKPDDTGRSALSDKQFVVVISRGGSYAPGTPREIDNHQEPLLRTHLGQLGVRNLTFLATEMTLSSVVPQLEQFADIFDSTNARTRERIRELTSA